MSYAPRRRKLNYKVVIPLLVLLVFIAYLGFHLAFGNTKETHENYTICNFSGEKTVETIHHKMKDDFTVADYTFYGESLALFKNAYTGEVSDPLSSMTVKLKNLCTGEETPYVLDKGLDRKVLLTNLSDGIYEIYVSENLTDKRVVFDGDVDDSITTITRNGKNKEVRVFTDQNILKDYDVKLKKNYLFLEISETKLKKDAYDVAIDPAGLDSSFTNGVVSNGNEGNGLVEAKEMYDAALSLKEKLESKGLKVLILRNDSDVTDTYGRDGRIAKAYNAGAKYYFRLAFDVDVSSDTTGFNILYSGHASNMFAARIGYDFHQKTGLKGCTIYMKTTDEMGVIQAALINGLLDERQVYDSDLWLRETGGRATQAGLYSENTKKGTASFAYNNPYGMNTLNIYFGFVSNRDDANTWKQQKEQIITSLADSISTYLQLED
ncbi:MULTISPECIES: N-acetylmuramoyl-L-alanine amidase [unclassified Breznakia]|uniref:N-acetylmuramoyl-L-alanine amidase n=1 Tax=unclassified Breznakia TaxID=2623764 RepID=UPI0024737C04|nr:MULTISPECIES: N-acetylmuramoyl-L-alanine amidase [unclassified Breznakia]MDH6365917.1 N-acetylmuramoyl-L-alanine amidase [Breznakia sp. PH1-1]MDH6403151.1 N-acetylmuramoyl-L-alanine amidase [Breznakia sp. PF1-11]MDH6410860.1 N-acetylmuramoyl-L-alanine amidase [Breznakia sp. PFB1-11]MDH6413083.1 N-acetylmuramoyl-L-alanine amidase [Breznakia sp. PFB1-14]MDH6415451.1 N-acetylmuramoyl-L-alanine amidase [Breznakia sp. PFB1-4]